MQFTLATLAVLLAMELGASALTPTAPAPPGCATNYAGQFEITVHLPPKRKRDTIERRATCAGDGILVATLSGGVLHDAHGRVGSIVANHQFQFDGPPPQAGAIYTGGWSVCSNGSLALGGSNIFYQCRSGNFYNLYDMSIGAQCQRVIIDIIPCTTGASGGATQAPDGQPRVSSATRGATQIGDGQIQASSAGPAPKPVSQFSDGQIQVTGSPVAQITDGQVQNSGKPTHAPVTQISDGQIQASGKPTVASSSAAPVSQISDGQIQATSAASVTTTPKPATTSPSAAPQFTGGAVSLVAVGAQVAAGAVAVAVVVFL